MKNKSIISILSIIVVLAMGGTLTYAVQQNPTDAGKLTGDKEKTTRRFALVVGANNGGRKRVILRYAVTDAKALIRVLESMGGVLPDDSRLLVEPNREALFWEMQRLKERIDRAKKKYRRVEVIFYYSGHSDEKSLLLGKEKISYHEFRDKINDMNADVRIAILDSCASGAFTRIKGGKKKAPFLVDSAYDMKGYAFMTSSSSNEASQESDRLKGSFFTHYLTAGMRGAADMTQDGRITLNEAYQFAFNETLSQTEKTVSGPQHPNYNIQMSGTGDVVMTDIRKSSAILRIGKKVGGKLFIHDKDQTLVVELNKPTGRWIDLGLEKGKYRVINIVDGEVRESKVKLPEGETIALHFEQFTKSKVIDTVARGDMKPRFRTRVYKRYGRKMNFYGAYNSKYTHAYGKTALMIGAKFGMTFNKSLSLGFAAYGNSSDFPMGHPVYAGASLEYAFPTISFINVKAGLFLGGGEEYLLNRNFFIVEPELALTLNFTRLLNVSLGASYRETSIKDSQMGRWSFTFSLRLGK